MAESLTNFKSSQLGNVRFSGWEGSRFSRRRVEYWKCFHDFSAFRDGFVENKVPSTCQGESSIEAYANTTWRDFDKNMMKQLRGSEKLVCLMAVSFFVTGEEDCTSLGEYGQPYRLVVLGQRHLIVELPRHNI
ncbi:hypothetical protein OUZ56_007451 [Daphnia magna]|uniref:Uncharacterized protein n=1 Tax=Daphnia magna TaxID=35525 RepID=A0ABR0A9Z8_9CRUS|nr:hypothetical protein OUZ56_007451 [Daphnia magna]